MKGGCRLIWIQGSSSKEVVECNILIYLVQLEDLLSVHVGILLTSYGYYDYAVFNRLGETLARQWQCEYKSSSFAI